MDYDSDKKPNGLDTVTSLENDDLIIIGDTSDTSKPVKAITKANLASDIGGGLSNVVEDTTPQLGGDLDLNGNVITGMEIGTDVQAQDAQLDSIAALVPGVEGRMITSNGLGGYQISTAAGVRGYLNVEDGADATDETNVTAAGALMDSEVTNLAEVKAFDSTDYKAAGADETSNVTAASTTAAGKVELTTTSEVNTGTDTTRAVTADALSGSVFGVKNVAIQVFEGATATATGDGKAYFMIPAELAGMNLVDIKGGVVTAGTTGTTDVQIANVTQALDMLSTKLTIDSGETTSETAATAAVINTATDDVAEGDVLRIDIDAVSTTAAQGLFVTLAFQLP